MTPTSFSMKTAAYYLTAALATLAVLVGASVADAGDRTSIWLVRDGVLEAVDRPARGVEPVLTALLAGPTAAERRRGFTSAIPRGVAIRAVVIKRRVVTVDLAARLVARGSDRSLRNRIRQVVRTLGEIPGVVGVRVRIEGGVPLGLVPGFDLRRALKPSRLAPELETTPAGIARALDALGYLPDGPAGPVEPERLSVGVLGFEKYAGLPRDGVIDSGMIKALAHARRPVPRQMGGPGNRVELLLDRQVALLVVDDRVQRIVHISSGAYGRTPAGSFRVFRKERMSWSVPFKVWLPWASYFVGGIAFHEYPSVPAYPASHGCVRVNRFDAPRIYGFAGRGTPVAVLSHA